MNLRKLCYLGVFLFFVTLSSTARATLIWADCPGGRPGSNAAFDEVCPDEGDYACPGGVQDPMSRCNCENHHGVYNESTGECEG